MFWFLAKVLAPIVVLGILVLVHEFGHFIVAKWCNVGVLKFAIGFGPSICRFRRGETIYQIGCIPLGGYVRMVGDMPDSLTGAQATDDAVRDGDEEVRPESPLQEEFHPEAEAMLRDRSRWFIEKGFWAKFAIVFAGPLFNFLLTLFFIFLCLAVYGERIRDKTPQLGGVMVGSPAEKASLRAGDLVKSLDGKPISDWDQLAETIHDGTGAPLALRIVRDGKELDVTAQPEAKVIGRGNERKNVYFLGITPLERYEHRSMSIFEAAKYSFLVTRDNTIEIYSGIWSMIRGKISSDELAGPLYIVKAAGHHAEKGLEDLMYLTAALSVSLAVLNLLPIPILDGGHLMFFILEALIGPISIRKKEVAQQLGLVFLLSLMVFAIKNDLFRKSPEDNKGPQHWESLGESPPPNGAPSAAPNAGPGSAPAESPGKP